MRTINIGSRVSCKSHWGYVTGTVTRIYKAYTVNTEEGLVRVPEIANILVDKTPSKWPYSIPEFAPEMSTLTLL
jgi:hypothetical protein